MMLCASKLTVLFFVVIAATFISITHGQNRTAPPACISGPKINGFQLFDTMTQRPIKRIAEGEGICQTRSINIRALVSACGRKILRVVFNLSHGNTTLKRTVTSSPFYLYGSAGEVASPGFLKRNTSYILQATAYWRSSNRTSMSVNMTSSGNATKASTSNTTTTVKFTTFCKK